MKKLKQNITRILVAVLVATSFASCDEVGDTDPGGTAVEAMAGDWYVQTLVDGEVVVDYVLLSTYNTAANDGKQMWMEDYGKIWDFKFKAPVNIGALTFSGDNLPSSVVHDLTSTPNVIETYDMNVTVTEGKVTKNGATTTGGHTVDGISFKAKFSDDPDGITYEIKGYKRTGFIEDEH